jgi:hypothetical protein
LTAEGGGGGRRKVFIGLGGLGRPIRGRAGAAAAGPVGWPRHWLLGREPKNALEKAVVWFFTLGRF